MYLQFKHDALYFYDSTYCLSCVVSLQSSVKISILQEEQQIYVLPKHKEKNKAHKYINLHSSKVLVKYMQSCAA